jgi:hypothetical protein
MQFFAIVSLCIFAGITYGVLHDQITANICVEYFTIGHPPIFGTDDPTLLGLGWGVLATWWVGVILGIPLAGAARLGNRPKRTAISLIRPLAVLMIISALCAALAGFVSALLARAGLIGLLEPLASEVPKAKHVAFLSDLWAHSGSYLSGFIGGGLIILHVWRRRRSESAA